MRQFRLPLKLSSFADFSASPRVLPELAALAEAEGWHFKAAQAEDESYEILAGYLWAVYRMHAESRAIAFDGRKEDMCIYMDRRFACFHTGLRTASNNAIYMLFTRNAPGEKTPWAFHRFLLDDDWWIRSIDPCPQYPYFHVDSMAHVFHPGWSVNFDFYKLLMDSEMMEYVPKTLRPEKAFQSAARAAVSTARRMAESSPNTVARMVRKGRVEYAIPLFFSGWSFPDVALLLQTKWEGTYTGHRMILPEDAYLRARLLGPIRTPWLKELVTQPLMGVAQYQQIKH